MNRKIGILVGLITWATVPYADELTMVGPAMVNSYANGVKQSIRQVIIIDAYNPNSPLDSATEELRKTAYANCVFNWQKLVEFASSSDPSISQLAAMRIRQLMMAAGDQPCGTGSTDSSETETQQ